MPKYLEMFAEVVVDLEALFGEKPRQPTDQPNDVKAEVKEEVKNTND